MATAAEKAFRLSRFVNNIRVTFQGGRGGDGCISMLHLFANEFAGPAGGNGGNGGHVVLIANEKVKSLNHVQTSYRGLPGIKGMSKNLYGANAEHKFVDVPVNTTVVKAPSKEIAELDTYDPELSDVVAELDEHGSMFIAARGGAGGRGNASYLSNTNRHPRIAEAGAMGEFNIYELRLNLYAHVGLIGLPNVGKSSLLRTLTHAKVKIGDYEFTTLGPQVGVVEYGDQDYTQLKISDLPGLIEESHNNRGLGIQFLRHVKQCVCLMYVIDLARPNPERQLNILFNELEAYKPGLSRRPSLVVGNKIDVEGAPERVGPFLKFLATIRPEVDFLPISCHQGTNLENVRGVLKRMYDQHVRNKLDN